MSQPPSPPPASEFTPAEPPADTTLPSEIWSDSLCVPEPPIAWLWHGYLAPRMVTLLTSQWKSGKTTLVSLLLSRLKTGGSLAGLAVVPGKAVVVSEEPADAWRRRRQHLDFGQHVCFLCRPFAAKPTPEQWLALLDHLAGLQAQHGLTLAVIDTLATFLPPHAESSPTDTLAALMPLRRLTDRGLAVLLVHHPRKGTAAPGQAARGNGALPSHADILIEMQWCASPTDTDRRRRLQSFSRFSETPRQLVIEWTADGRDYTPLGDFRADEFAHNWAALRLVFEDAARKLTRRQLLQDWPQDLPRPAEASLWRWLDHAVAAGLLFRDGTGRKNDPYRFWLPEQEERWRNDPCRLPDPADVLRTLHAQIQQQLRPEKKK